MTQPQVLLCIHGSAVAIANSACSASAFFFFAIISQAKSSHTSSISTHRCARKQTVMVWQAQVTIDEYNENLIFCCYNMALIQWNFEAYFWKKTHQVNKSHKPQKNCKTFLAKRTSFRSLHLLVLFHVSIFTPKISQTLKWTFPLQLNETLLCNSNGTLKVDYPVL